MAAGAPHYLLVSEATEPESGRERAARWRFVLKPARGGQKLMATDAEPDASGERLALLAVVRGLEALDQPSRVTLLTTSRYVSRGIEYGLEEWRETGWRWERFGRYVPLPNRDLWQRVDQALKYHRVECHRWRLDGAHTTSAVPRPKGMTRVVPHGGHALRGWAGRREGLHAESPRIGRCRRRQGVIRRGIDRILAWGAGISPFGRRWSLSRAL